MKLGVRILVRLRLPVAGAPGAETAGVGRERSVCVGLRDEFGFGFPAPRPAGEEKNACSGRLVGLISDRPEVCSPL